MKNKQKVQKKLENMILGHFFSNFVNTGLFRGYERIRNILFLT